MQRDLALTTVYQPLCIVHNTQHSVMTLLPKYTTCTCIYVAFHWVRNQCCPHLSSNQTTYSGLTLMSVQWEILHIDSLCILFYYQRSKYSLYYYLIHLPVTYSFNNRNYVGRKNEPILIIWTELPQLNTVIIWLTFWKFLHKYNEVSSCFRNLYVNRNSQLNFVLHWYKQQREDGKTIDWTDWYQTFSQAHHWLYIVMNSRVERIASFLTL